MADSIFNNIECRYLSQKKKQKYTGKTYRYDRRQLSGHMVCTRRKQFQCSSFSRCGSRLLLQKTSEAAASDSTSKRCLRNLAMPNTGLAVQLNHTKNWQKKTPNTYCSKRLRKSMFSITTTGLHPPGKRLFRERHRLPRLIVVRPHQGGIPPFIAPLHIHLY